MRLLLLALAMFPCVAGAVPCATATSPAHTNALVELYTSEGCDSCPPADRWLSRFAAAAPAAVVPIAFHVDYWDYIGWKDRFADPGFAERQRAQARLRGSRAIYTPQVVLAGRDWPGWRSEAEFARGLASVTARPARAKIELRWDRPAGRAAVASLAVEALPGERPERLTLHVATLESGLSSRVTAGENKGATLQHDFVVRDFASIPFSPTSRALSEARDLTAREGWNAERLSVAVFVQDRATGEVLQALAAPICRP
jgi:hypothetical protein